MKATADLDHGLAYERIRAVEQSAGILAVLMATLFLVWFDLVRRVRGFTAIHSMVRGWPVWRPRSNVDFAQARRLCIAVDRGASLYFKHPWCLQRSAATVAVLRLLGFPAEMMLGVRRVPFRAHAWVEMCGVVMNDRPEVQRAYHVLEKC